MIHRSSGKPSRPPEVSQAHRSLLDAMPQCAGIYAAVRDSRGRVLDFRVEYVNDAACRFWGLPLAEQAGRRLGDLFPAHRESGLFAAYCRVVDTGRPLVRERFPYTGLFGRRARTRVLDLHAGRIDDGVIVTWHEASTGSGVQEPSRGRDAPAVVTAPQPRSPRSSAREAAPEASDGGIDGECQLRSVLESARIGAWVYIVDDNRWELDAHARRLYQQQASPAVHDEETVRQFLHPDDVEPMWTAVARATDPEGDGRYETEYRILQPDGGVRWLSAWGQTEFEGQGASRRAVRIVGASRDVTEQKVAELALRESEERFRLLADNITQLAWMKDATGHTFWFNKRWYDYTGATPEEMQGWGWRRCHHPDHVDRVVESLKTSLETGEPWNITFPLRGANGQYRWFLTRAVPIRNDHGEIIRWFGTNTDITEQRETEAALRRSEERYRAIVEGQAEMVCRFRPDGTILFANGAYARSRGTTPEALVGVNFWRFVKDEDQPAVRSLLDSLRPDSPQVQIENRFETTDGPRWILWTNRALAFDQHGRATEVQSAGIDITDRKRVERALADSEARMSALIDQLPVGVGVTDARGRLLAINPAGIRLHGADALDRMPRDIDGYQHVFELRYPDGRVMPFHDWPIARAMRGEFVRDYEARLRRRDGGAERAVAYSAVPVRDGRGEGQVLFVIHDLTERRRAEETRRQAHETFRYLVENSPFGVYAIDADFRLVTVSAGAQRVFRNVRPLIGRDFADVLRTVWPEPFAGEAIARFRHTLETGEPYHSPRTVERRQDIGEVESYDWKIERVTLPDGRHGVVCHFYDLSERQRYEQALRESEERFRLATAAGKVGVWDWNLADDTVTWSDAIYDMHGLERDRFDGTGRAFAALIHPDDRAAMEQALRRAIDEGAPYELEYRVVRPDGEVVWIYTNAKVVRNEHGQAVRILGGAVDITERKRHEEHLQTIMAELNHRVKNTLAVIQSVAQQTALSSPDLESFQESFQERLRSMAAAHSLLTRSNWEGAPLREIIEGEMRTRAGSIEQFETHGPPIALRPKAALAINMAVHELATNACKYGALAAPAGRVEVRWEVYESERQPWLRILWVEHCPDGVGPPHRDGFGSRLLDQVLRYELEGEVEREFTATGLRCVIRFPLAGTPPTAP